MAPATTEGQCTLLPAAGGLDRGRRSSRQRIAASVRIRRDPLGIQSRRVAHSRSGHHRINTKLSYPNERLLAAESRCQPKEREEIHWAEDIPR
jgi:hypothetical protein